MGLTCSRTASWLGILVFPILLRVVIAPVSAGEKSPAAKGESSQEAPRAYDRLVRDDEPVAYWKLDGGDVKNVANHAAREPNADALSGTIVGSVTLGEPGPRAKRYPAFAATNRAAMFAGTKGFIRVKDPGENSPLDFGLGDSITLEAWVHPLGVRNDQHLYVVGKGRTNNPGVARDNQNYALRLRGMGGTARVSFLYRRAGTKPGDRNGFSRWNSETGFEVGTGWHHIAVCYTFGKLDSIRGYIDGKPVTGSWDLGGETDPGPVVDNDEVWIGSSVGGNANCTFNGFVDEVAVYRRIVEPEQMAARFQIDPTQREPDFLVDDAQLPQDAVLVEILEGIPDNRSWTFAPRAPRESYLESAFAMTQVPNKYSSRGIRTDRTNPFVVRATGLVRLPEGKLRMLVRSRSAARVFVDGRIVVEAPFHRDSSNAHHKVHKVETELGPDVRPAQPGDSDGVAEFVGDGEVHRVRLEVHVGGRKRRPELGETLLAIAREQEPFKLLSATLDVPLTDAGWASFADDHRQRLAVQNASRRKAAGAEESKYWAARHAQARRELKSQPAIELPELAPSTPIGNDIDRFILQQLDVNGLKPGPLTDDWSFLRRVSLDVVGKIPSPELTREFFSQPSAGRRAKLINRLLADPGWADHWVAYWQDVLAENPNIVNPTLNNTGPFRFWIYDSFLDNKPFDRFATELVRMEGSEYFGGPAGFGMATQNDAPMAAKAHVVAQAFLGMQLKCARCHDAPYHHFTQENLFSLAAMLGRGAQKVPGTSTVPLGEGGQSANGLVKVTLKPGQAVAPIWPFVELVPADLPDGMIRSPGDTREQLAALITSPRNGRFARVIVNRMWQRYFGTGLVEPVDDWENAAPSHPQLLDYLARQLVENNYDLKHLARLILNSHSYQRAASTVDSTSTESASFAAGRLRRMSAEQVIDSLFAAAGKPLDCEDLNIDVDGSRLFTKSLNLGHPSRGWHFTSLSNERDRPSLALPRAQSVVDVLTAFGWRSSRQSPLTVRSSEPTVLQPAILANGIVGRRIMRLSDDSAFTELALNDQPLEAFIDAVFLRTLTRKPTAEERVLFSELLGEGYADRRVKGATANPSLRHLRRSGVSWTNHLDPEANKIKIQMEREARAGDPPTEMLESDWRERAEDMVWSLVNSPEFLFVP